MIFAYIITACWCGVTVPFPRSSLPRYPSPLNRPSFASDGFAESTKKWKVLSYSTLKKKRYEDKSAAIHQFLIPDSSAGPWCGSPVSLPSFCFQSLPYFSSLSLSRSFSWSSLVAAGDSSVAPLSFVSDWSPPSTFFVLCFIRTFLFPASAPLDFSSAFKCRACDLCPRRA